MGSKRLETIDDFHRHGYRIRAECERCRRLVILEPLPILTRCFVTGWSRQLAAVESRMVCAECGSKRARLGPAFGD